jgi:hypothetical protein
MLKPFSTLQGKSFYVFISSELRGLSPNFNIQVSVSDLYIPRIGPHISLQQNRQTDPGNICINLSQIYECRNWETEHYNSVLEITVSFLGYIKRKQTFILDSHRPFICSANLFETPNRPPNIKCWVPAFFRSVFILSGIGGFIGILYEARN